MNYKLMMTGLLSLQMLFTKTSWDPTAKAMNGKTVAAEINNVPEEIKNSCKPTKLINVPYINQNDIVYGCEAVSSTMLLQYYGYEISEKDFTDKYLIKKDWFVKSGHMHGPDPHATYAGNPYESSGKNFGFGIFAPGTAKSIDKVVDTKKHKTKITTGMNLIDLIKNYIDKDIPVLIWATMDMKETSPGRSWIINYVDENSPYKIGDIFTWMKGEHCLVLVGYDDNNYYFNDPYKNHGVIPYEKKLVNQRFLELGKQSVVILEKSLEVPLEEQLEE
ncbi:MAG: C39 family peptidase [Clostridia bacterium]|nr:C39 family peptidase [Clostridia bacterium]